MAGIRSHVRGNIVGYVALFFALSGGALAVTTAAKNSVNSRAIINGQVMRPDLRANAVNSSKVADGSLSGGDLGDGSVSGGDVGDGSLSGSDIGDSSLSGADIGAGSLTGGDVAADSMGTREVDEVALDATLQRSLSSGCSTGKALADIGNFGDPTCASILPQAYAFIRTGGCCSGAPPLNPPVVLSGRGVTSVSNNSTGQYQVHFDSSLLPQGGVSTCVPMLSKGTNDNAFGLQGEISFIARSFSSDILTVVHRNAAGSPANIHTGGGGDGFSIALFC